MFDLQNVVTETKLPREEFERRYRDLYRVFSERYSVHRGQVRLRDSEGGVVPGTGPQPLVVAGDPLGPLPASHIAAEG